MTTQQGAAPDTSAKVASAIDTAGSASAVLLRDLHCALLRAVEDKGLEKEKPQPSQAKLLSPDSAGPVPWTANVARVILSAPVTRTTVPAQVLLNLVQPCCTFSTEAAIFFLPEL